ncbi:hypothetical protein PUN28_016037 [Cardiocondyla obscurior]|uniref:Uncharacterized protein n=1 Tax=Cardiocondyla obscurior TaxID=286306 RepID=A0AAW2EV08_9HYME
MKDTYHDLRMSFCHSLRFLKSVRAKEIVKQNSILTTIFLFQVILWHRRRTNPTFRRHPERRRRPRKGILPQRSNPRIQEELRCCAVFSEIKCRTPIFYYTNRSRQQNSTTPLKQIGKSYNFLICTRSVRIVCSSK